MGVYSDAFISALATPARRLTGAEWADQYRFVASSTSPEPGRWRTSRVPYMTDPLNDATDPLISHLVLCCASQVGKSELLLNALGYYVDQDPAPILMLQPTIEAAAAFSKERIAPMISATPVLANKVQDAPQDAPGGRRSESVRLKQFPGGFIALVGSNSPAGLASRPIRVLLCDEVDRYGMTKEGAPLDLAMQRTVNFYNRKIIMVSTPTLYGGSAIYAHFLKSDQRYYWIPCPHCGDPFVWTWDRVAWDMDSKDRPDLPTARIICPHCGGIVRGAGRPDTALLSRGRWVAQHPERSIRGYHLNSLLSPWINLSDLVREYCDAVRSRNRESLMAFTNLKLGEPWRAESAIDEIWEYLHRRGVPLPVDPPEGREAYLSELRGRAVNSLGGFISIMRPSYVTGWAHDVINQTLDRFVQGVINHTSPRLIITLPPRHGKTDIIGRLFTAYMLGIFPDFKLLFCAYSADLSRKICKDVQRGINDPAYGWMFPGVILPRTGAAGATYAPYGRDYTRSADAFELPGHRGGFRAVGLNSHTSGADADVLIIDDPAKDMNDSQDAAWDVFRSVLYPQVSAGGGVLIVASRTRQDDLIGRLLEDTAGRWEVLNFPALATEPDEHRSEGDPLMPLRYSAESLAEIKSSVGFRVWEARYQGRPLPLGGGVIDPQWIRHYSAVPETYDKIVMSWDMTFKDTTGADFVVGQVWMRSGGAYYLLDQVRGRWAFVETVQQVINFCRKHPRVTRKLIEDKANGSAVIDALRRDVPGIVPVNPKESKIARLNAVSTLFEAGNVYIPCKRDAPWVADYEAELIAFPGGAHDDQVDATTQALTDLQNGGRINAANIQRLLMGV